MLYLVFHIGESRYALEATRVVEVIPFVELKPLSHAPPGIAGVFNYRGQPVPAVDLSQLASGCAAVERLSTRILVVNCPDAAGNLHLLGLVTEHATEILRRGAEEIADPGVRISTAPFLGPVMMDSQGPIQLIYEDRLLPAPVHDFVSNPS